MLFNIIKELFDTMISLHNSKISQSVLKTKIHWIALSVSGIISSFSEIIAIEMKEN